MIKRIFVLGVVLMVACSERTNEAINTDENSTDTELKKPLKPKAIEQAPKPLNRPRSIWVQKAKGNRQCEAGGITLPHSTNKLITSGVTVLESRCGVRTDSAYPSVCGGATGDILLHRIASTHLDSALELGFNPAQTGKFEFDKCEDNEVWATSP